MGKQMKVEAVATWAPLKAVDRCDTGECRGRTVVRVHYGINSLDFCGHHFTQVEGKALANDVEPSDVLGSPTHIQDERQRILAEEDKREGVG